MAAAAKAIRETPVRGSFEAIRDRLYEQFQRVPFAPETGLAPDELRREARAYLDAHPDQPRVLQKANLYRLVVTRGQIRVDPEDWYADKLNHGGILRRLGADWLREAQAGSIREEAAWFERSNRLGAVHGGLDTGHISPGWENMFARGLRGLIDQARRSREDLGSEATPGQAAFLEAVEIVYRATIALSERFAAAAEGMVRDHPAHEERLRAVASVCRRVPAERPRTLHEALQFAWLMHELIEMEGEYVRSMGHFDRLFAPYYRSDVESGRLTPGQAKELIKFLWIKFHARTRGRANGKNFVFGGQHRDGSEAANELTDLAMEAYEELNAPDPKLSVRYTPRTPRALRRRVADLIRRGHNSFVLMNDVPAVEAQVRRGKTLEDARTYLPIGCYEPAVDGKEAGCTMNLVVNLAKGVELALGDGVDPLSGERIGPRTGDPRTFASFDDLFGAYAAQMEHLLARSVACVRAHERMWPRINPSPLIAGTIEDCLGRGRDIGEGGPIYNGVGCVGMGLGSACDSLLGLKRAVFDEAVVSMEGMLAALRSDFQGHEALRHYLMNRTPKWGTDDPEADALARRIADHYCGKVHGFTNARGGPVQAALFSLNYMWTMGRATGALPDGRRAGSGLSPGVGATTGQDRRGVTALLNSVSRLDFNETPNGSVLDLMLHPTAVQGEDGLEAMVDLIETFFDRGGYAVQFNVVGVETLKEAQEHPERYESLQIRVTGWSVFWNSLSRFEQDQFIARNSHKL